MKYLHVSAIEKMEIISGIIVISSAEEKSLDDSRN